MTGQTPPCVHYAIPQVDEIAAKVALLGRATLLAKIDRVSILSAPSTSQDQLLQEIRWYGHFYIDTVLPFGLRSAAKIFNAVADALNWHMQRTGVEFVDHYLDDYIILGSPGTSQCQRSLDTVVRECRTLGIILDKKLLKKFC